MDAMDAFQRHGLRWMENDVNSSSQRRQLDAQRRRKRTRRNNIDAIGLSSRKITKTKKEKKNQKGGHIIDEDDAVDQSTHTHTHTHTHLLPHTQTHKINQKFVKESLRIWNRILTMAIY